MREGTVRDRCLAILKEYFADDDDAGVVERAETGSVDIFAPAGALVRDADKLDSLDRTEYVMAVEDEFGIEISDDVAAAFRTFDDLVKRVEASVGPAHGAH